MFKVFNFSRKRYKIAFCICVIGLLGVIAAGLKPDYVDVFAQNSPKRKLPIYCVETDKKQIAISFDAAWGAQDTDKLLQILDENNVKTTFFLCGYWVDDYPDEVKKIFEAGHDIGNHSNTHPHSNQLSLEKNKAEIKAAHDKVKMLLGIDMNLYRPPFGEYNDTALQAAESLGYYSIQWDIDTLETKMRSVYKPLFL